MSTDPIIEREDGPTKGRYVLRDRGVEAELTWSVLDAHHIIADHTFVPDEMRGTGAGKRLVERLVADSRAGKVKVTPLCPFVKSMYLRHPEWSDVFG